MKADDLRRLINDILNTHLPSFSTKCVSMADTADAGVRLNFTFTPKSNTREGLRSEYLNYIRNNTEYDFKSCYLYGRVVSSAGKSGVVMGMSSEGKIVLYTPRGLANMSTKKFRSLIDTTGINIRAKSLPESTRGVVCKKRPGEYCVGKVIEYDTLRKRIRGMYVAFSEFKPVFVPDDKIIGTCDIKNVPGQYMLVTRKQITYKVTKLARLGGYVGYGVEYDL